MFKGRGIHLGSYVTCIHDRFQGLGYSFCYSMNYQYVRFPGIVRFIMLLYESSA